MYIHGKRRPNEKSLVSPRGAQFERRRFLCQSIPRFEIFRRISATGTRNKTVKVMFCHGQRERMMDRLERDTIRLKTSRNFKRMKFPPMKFKSKTTVCACQSGLAGSLSLSIQSGVSLVFLKRRAGSRAHVRSA